MRSSDQGCTLHLLRYLFFKFVKLLFSLKLAFVPFLKSLAKMLLCFRLLNFLLVSSTSIGSKYLSVRPQSCKWVHSETRHFSLSHTRFVFVLSFYINPELRGKVISVGLSSGLLLLNLVKRMRWLGALFKSGLDCWSFLC